MSADLQESVEAMGLDDGHSHLGQSLLDKCKALLKEVEDLQQILLERKKSNEVELRHFKSSVKSELKSLERLVNADPNAAKIAHTLRSSNFPFYAAVWSAAKTCNGVTALEKRFYWTPNPRKDTSKPCQKKDLKLNRNGALVDIVAQDGAEWVKVSTVTEKRILFDMAKQGWVGDFSSDESDGEGSNDDGDEDDAEGLLKQAEVLVRASRATRVNYRHPSVRLVLPKIKWGGAKEVDNMLHQIQDLGITLVLAPDVPDDKPLSKVADDLFVDAFAGLTTILNIDCTILLALVSDLSHSRVEAADWHNRAILRQIEMEREEQLLPNSLWPACGAKEMLCTREAAVRMHEIVNLIGTESEKARAAFLLDDVESTKQLTREGRVQGFQRHSEYDVPSSWNLPIKVVEVDIAAMKTGLPHIADKVEGILSTINQSVFFYGWSTGMTTISSNRTVAKDIENVIEANRQSENERGPDIWLCPTARSLVGKEKKRRGFH